MARLSLRRGGGAAAGDGGAPRDAPQPDPFLLFRRVVLAEIWDLLYCFPPIPAPPLIFNCQFAAGGAKRGRPELGNDKAGASLCDPNLSTRQPRC